MKKTFFCLLGLVATLTLASCGSSYPEPQKVLDDAIAAGDAAPLIETPLLGTLLSIDHQRDVACQKYLEVYNPLRDEASEKNNSERLHQIISDINFCFQGVNTYYRAKALPVAESLDGKQISCEFNAPIVSATATILPYECDNDMVHSLYTKIHFDVQADSKIIFTTLNLRFVDADGNTVYSTRAWEQGRVKLLSSSDTSLVFDRKLGSEEIKNTVKIIIEQQQAE